MIEIRLPQYGMGMHEGQVTQWFKRVGDALVAGDLLAEIEAEKTTEEIVAPEDGVLAEILVPEGVLVPVQELLAVMVAVGEPIVTSGAPVHAAPAAAAPAPRRPVVGAAGPPGAAGSVTPRARALAKELGVDLATVVGSGPGGRITDDDVRAAGRRLAARRTVPAGAEGVRMTGMRRTIAQRMHASLHTMAQLTLVTTTDVTELVAYRDQLDRSGRPSYTDFMVRASALALRQHPRLNATVRDDAIVVHPAFHLGVATALEDGLVVPVIRHADRKALREIAAESADLVRRARAGTLTADELSGGTFTVSSLGGLGIDAFTPIVNPPEVAILGVGRVVDHPVPDGAGVRWRKAITLSLTVDHRVVDGVPGAAFLAAVGSVLQDPAALDRPPG